MGAGQAEIPPNTISLHETQRMCPGHHLPAGLTVLCFHQDHEFLLVMLTRFFNRKEGLILSMAPPLPPEDFRVILLCGRESRFPASPSPQEAQDYPAERSQDTLHPPAPRLDLLLLGY